MDEYNALTESQVAVKVQLARMGMNQADLARTMGVLPGTVSRALGSSPLDERSKTWPAMLEALGLEIIIRPVKSAVDETAEVLADHPEVMTRVQKLKAGKTALVPWGEVKAKMGL